MCTCHATDQKRLREFAVTAVNTAVGSENDNGTTMQTKKQQKLEKVNGGCSTYMHFVPVGVAAFTGVSDVAARTDDVYLDLSRTTGMACGAAQDDDEWDKVRQLVQRTLDSLQREGHPAISHLKDGVRVLWEDARP